MPVAHRSGLAALLLAIQALVVPIAGSAPVQGDTPPPYVGVTLDGDPVLLTDHPGKALVVSFWATWCAYCLQELPILNNIQTAAGKDKVQVIAVNTESREVFRRVSRALRTLDLQLAYDPDKKGQGAYGVHGIPHMVIIGRDGKVVSIYRGYDEKSLDSIVVSINRAIGATQ
jgi:thiol-disulfide isomerase/thioredoxin